METPFTFTNGERRMNDITRYQRATDNTAIYPGAAENGFHGLSYVTLGLVGEAGEICNKVKKIARDCSGLVNNDHRTALAEELGDVLWYAAQLATQMGLDLGQIAAANITKLMDRKERGVLQGSGDQR
jgi:NTP pyrophosphatase (non-canonical NTP hydrolase)